MNISLLPFFVAGLVFGILISFVYIKIYFQKKKLNEIEIEKKKVLEQAYKEAEEIKTKAQDFLKKAEAKIEEWKEKERRKIERDFHLQKREIDKAKRELEKKEAELEKKKDILMRKEMDLRNKEKNLILKEQDLALKEKKINEVMKQEMEKLEEIARMTRDEARKELLRIVEQQASVEAAQLAYKIKEEAKKKAEEEAKEIIATAIHRYAAPVTSETTLTILPIPTNDLKGRIIGREGRNVRAFEAITGVELIIDDTPEAILLSAYDAVRREKARLTLEKLIQDGRIHPARIEEVWEEVEKDFENYLRKMGEEIVAELGLSGFHPELLKIIAKLKFKTSYGQNLLQHSKEVAHFAGLMAGELDLDVKIAKRAGLLHDIGKVLTEDYEGSHAIVGAQFAKRYGENDIVVNAIAAHHEEEKAKTPYAILVAAADAISGSRPGARRESIEAYIERVETLEKIARSFPGVLKAFSLRAGREIRVIVEADKVTDSGAYELAKKIAKAVEEELEYPGQIKVTVIREVRAVEYAK